MTTKTSSLSSASLAALADELTKIAAAKKPAHKKPAAPKPEEKKPLSPAKKFLRNTAVIGAGTGAGYGGGMLAEKAIQKIKNSPMPKDKKLRLLGAGLGLASTGAFVAREWIQHARKEAAR